ncbi:MAG: hypothetical protein V1495_08770 [Pseudomonadota bacterium]
MTRSKRFWLFLLLVAACGSDSPAGGSGGTAVKVDNTCSGGKTLADSLLSALGKDHLLIGATMEDDIAAAAPFDIRYNYIAGGIATTSDPCGSCPCGSTNWWGCWQSPPGHTALFQIENAKANHQIPMFSYYQINQSAGVGEGAALVTKAADAVFMARYLKDWRFLLQTIGTEPVFLHVEPDFWGYAQGVNSDPTKIAAAVASANGTDCSDKPDTIAGLGQCMIAMVRKYAPNAKVGLHASGWAVWPNGISNSDSSADITTPTKALGAFLKACGDADFIVADISDRDAVAAGWWWNATNTKLPDFHQANQWATILSEEMQRPVLWWQVPVGTGSRDNRLDYFFAHMDELAASNVLGVAYGAGIGGQTTPSTDGGNLVAKTKAYVALGGQKPCK